MSAKVPAPVAPGQRARRGILRRTAATAAAVALALTVTAMSVAEPVQEVVAQGDGLVITAPSVGRIDDGPGSAPAPPVSVQGWADQLDAAGYTAFEQSLLEMVARYGRSTDGYLNGRLPDHALCRLPWLPHHRLRCDAAHQLTALNELFREEFGRDLPITDSYRTFESQVRLRQRVPHLAAVPGTSMHGWGLAVDFGVPINTGRSAEYVWLRVYGPRFGWDNPPWARLDGSKPEPWHFEFFAADPIPRRAMSPSDVAHYGSMRPAQRPSNPPRDPVPASRPPVAAPPVQQQPPAPPQAPTAPAPESPAPDPERPAAPVRPAPTPPQVPAVPPPAPPVAQPQPDPDPDPGPDADQDLDLDLPPSDGSDDEPVDDEPVDDQPGDDEPGDQPVDDEDGVGDPDSDLDEEHEEGPSEGAATEGAESDVNPTAS